MISIKSKKEELFHPTNPEVAEIANTRVALQLKPSGHIIPKGTPCSILFGTLNDEWYLRASGLTDKNGTPTHFSIITKKVTQFFEPPSLEELQSEDFNNGTCPTVLGHTVEPDGIDQDGSPSWFRALGLI
jgi:hypothetical protein